jgi:peptide methionine sulfoxide reductase MsrB
MDRRVHSFEKCFYNCFSIRACAYHQDDHQSPATGFPFQQPIAAESIMKKNNHPHVRL